MDMFFKYILLPVLGLLVVCAVIGISCDISRKLKDVKTCVSDGHKEWECRAIIMGGSRHAMPVIVQVRR